MARIGADVERLEQLSGRCDAWARVLIGAVTSIEGMVTGVDWDGPDAGAFRGRWRNQLRRELTAVGTRVEEMATTLFEQAHAQRLASGDGGLTGFPIRPGAPELGTTPQGPVPIRHATDPGGGGGSSAPVGPPTTDVDVEDLTAAQKDALADEYAPVLKFDEEEEHFLGDPEEFLERSSLREHWSEQGAYNPYGGGSLPHTYDEELIPSGDVDGNDLHGLNPDRDHYLDLDDDDDLRAGDLDKADFLYEVSEDGEGKYVTYWLHYPYNDGPSGQNHEGDWERIEVRLDEVYGPEGVAFSGHGSPTWRDWSDVELTEDGRPVAYVADGTHANYPEPGVWDTDGPPNEDAFGEGETFDLGKDAGPPIDASTLSWYDSGVPWGDMGNFEFTSGPTGPGDKGSLYENDGLNEDTPNGWVDSLF